MIFGYKVENNITMILIYLKNYVLLLNINAVSGVLSKMK